VPYRVGDGGENQQDDESLNAAGEEKSGHAAADFSLGDLLRRGELLIGGDHGFEQWRKLFAGDGLKVLARGAEVIGGGVGGAVHGGAGMSRVKALAVGEQQGFSLLGGEGAEGADEREISGIASRRGIAQGFIRGAANMLAGFEDGAMIEPPLYRLAIAELWEGLERLLHHNANDFAAKAHLPAEPGGEALNARGVEFEESDESGPVEFFRGGDGLIELHVGGIVHCGGRVAADGGCRYTSTWLKARRTV
jgi:hypothetical protein